MKENNFYKEKLIMKKEQFYNNYESNKNQSIGPREEVSGDLVDQATDDYTKEFMNNLSSADLKTLKLIEEALEVIDTEEYGICQECGEEISEKRLKAIPWAQFCLNCQEKKENED
jgi:DnaK suppressor protein